MKALIFLFVVIVPCFANAQEIPVSKLENGKLFGIFPVVENLVVYEDTLVFAREVQKESIFEKANAFFKANREAKYFFESENKEDGELIYQGQKNDLHFNISIRIPDNICVYRIYEIVIASTEVQYMMTEHGGKLKTGEIDHAVNLENISPGKGDYSRKNLDKIDQRFVAIMEGLKTALRQ